MATQTKFPTFSNTESGGAPEDTEAWVSPANIRADDGTESTITAATFDSPDISFWLTGNTFGFTIPAGATIDGIVVEIERSNAAGAASDHRVQCRSGGAFVGDNKAATATDWPTAAAIATYGSSTDDWLPAGTWTPAQINDAGFGLTLTVQADAPNTDVGVDFFRVTVHYTPLTGVVLDATPDLPAGGLRHRLSGVVKDATPDQPAATLQHRIAGSVLDLTPDMPAASIDEIVSVGALTLDVTPDQPAASLAHRLPGAVLDLSPDQPVGEAEHHLNAVALDATPDFPAGAVTQGTTLVGATLDATPDQPAATLRHLIAGVVLDTAPDLPIGALQVRLAAAVLSISPDLPAGSLRHQIAGVVLNLAPDLPTAALQLRLLGALLDMAPDFPAGQITGAEIVFLSEGDAAVASGREGDAALSSASEGRSSVASGLGG